MRPRAIGDLIQLSDGDFFKSISEGLEAVLRNASQLSADAQFLGNAERQVGARILDNVAREETAKALILMDAIRCPRQPEKRLSDHLARFNNHLAKGLYVEAYCMARITLTEIQHFLDFSRKQYYLDGPNDVDWVFRNSILDERERAMYVDYEDTDEGHRWSDPGSYSRSVLRCFPALRVVVALGEIGVFSVPALEVIADFWRGVTIGSDTDTQVELNVRTLKALEARSLLADSIPEDALRFVIHDWKLPLVDLDLKEIPVKVDDLREHQRNWNPGGYY